MSKFRCFYFLIQEYMVQQLTTQNDVRRAMQSPKLAIVDCFAEWCGPCKILAPALEQLQKAYPAVSIYKVDVDVCDIDDMMIGNDTISVTSLPTVFFAKNGQLLETVVGCHIQKIEQLIQKHM
jgi:thioredoxin 1